MDLAAVMDAISTRLDTIADLRCFAYPPPLVSPPAAYVDYPETVTFDETYARGMDRMTLPVAVVVGKVSDRAARDKLATYCAGAGAASVKAVLESGTYSAFDAVRVMTIDFDYVLIAGSTHVEARFSLDIAGQGSA